MKKQDMRTWGPASESTLLFAAAVTTEGTVDQADAFYAGFLAFAALAAKVPDVGRAFATAIIAEAGEGGGIDATPPDSTIEALRDIARMSRQRREGAAT